MIVETAPAKINLALHVRARRDDGYHEIETLFAFLSDGDVLRLAPGPASFALEGPFGVILSAEGDNLVTRAAAAFARAFDLPSEGAFTLDKRLPVASGIGGGSADAAAALRALARRNGIAIDDPRLFACADALGSDVPACLYGRSALGRGRGERLEPLDGLAGVPVLLVNPGVAVSTGAVFSAWDRVDRGPIGDGDLLERALLGRNDLEAPARSIAPVIGEALAMLEGTANTRLVRMSGSGATCFALYESEADRAAAAAAIGAARPEWWRLESTLA
ncbi:4-(cytidine 5'-diphospho)-2-C-methyl-D-erythritol kinase [Sphingomonas oligophenolica]|uniref:4-diphosphocytidyl-2-C-methyl-D-erythritol kinase n=1 Tax=Sphingomonas oligophenolica TaxID=301154 RepID=A0ABU9Y5D8_9SPHN